MSKLEKRVERDFFNRGIKYVCQYPIPENIRLPWCSLKITDPHKVDFYLPDCDLYIEVKGFMTIEAMTKMTYLCNQLPNYYVFQGTEKDWAMSLLMEKKDFNNFSQTQIKDLVYRFQLEEIQEFNKTKGNFYSVSISRITKERINLFLKQKLNDYREYYRGIDEKN